jgi:hypothetical protein
MPLTLSSLASLPPRFPLGRVSRRDHRRGFRRRVGGVCGAALLCSVRRRDSGGVPVWAWTRGALRLGGICLFAVS